MRRVPRRSGSPLDPECDPASHKLSAAAPHYLLIDTNVALHQVRLCVLAGVDCKPRHRAGLPALGQRWGWVPLGLGYQPLASVRPGQLCTVDTIPVLTGEGGASGGEELEAFPGGSWGV
jgi:hypothetical protein